MVLVVQGYVQGSKNVQNSPHFLSEVAAGCKFGHEHLSYHCQTVCSVIEHDHPSQTPSECGEGGGCGSV